MAATIAQASVAFSKFFGGGGNYSHFTLHTEEPGEAQVGLTDASDGREPPDATDQSGGSPSCRPRPSQQLSRRNTCYVALATFLIFIIGYLVGYVTHRSPHLQPPSSGCVPKPEVEEENEVAVSAEEPPLYWKNIPDLLGKKLTAAAFDKTMRDLAMDHHEAGSGGDNLLASRVFDMFRRLQMEPWKDEHFVQLQKPDSERPNRVLIGSEEVGQPKGYLAYSAKGTVQGKAVYGNYGRLEDLDVLLKNNIELKGCVMLLRAGRISFAQQVLNAAGRGASAVLIYRDPQDYNYVNTTELYGHVHLGSGDPYTPGFPSLNHTQFPPTQSSGLPYILAQTITAETAGKILRKMGGPVADSGFHGNLVSVTYRLGGVASDHNVTVEVHNTLVDTRIYNVFGVIKGFSDPDRYVVLGAQRDAWGPGYAKSTVGTTILMELARVMHDMVENDNFRPLRSIVFASWSAGEYGSVGSTEWLEAYMSSLDKKVFTYISLDGAVAGLGSFTASASPLLNSLLESAMKEVDSPVGSGSLYASVGGNQWAKKVLRPMAMEDPAYPFLAFSGIPSLSFRFVSTNAKDYPLYGTVLDTADHLAYATNQRTGEMAASAGRLAGLVALKLVHSHLLPLHLDGYASAVFQAVLQVNRHVDQFSKSGNLPGVSTQWLTSALSSFRSAARAFRRDVDNTDLNDQQACRALNDRLMAVEHNLLSPYVSPRSVPFRHLLLGRGAHTLASIAETTDAEQLHTQLALATWTLQGCVNAMAAHLWDVDNQI